ncbi:HEPN domain-containing protein [Phormidium pseudopriestleyi]|nr:HEPN domain-containing protein [Phormidium pseudopriestleyi]
MAKAKAPDSYDRRLQLGASRRRLEDAESLFDSHRWTGSMYLGGYAIECSLKSLICYKEEKSNLKETKPFKDGLQGSNLHNLTQLLGNVESIEKAIELDRTKGYKTAWTTVCSLWRSDDLRYSNKLGDEQECKNFIEAVKKIYQLILSQQGE